MAAVAFIFVKAFAHANGAWLTADAEPIEHDVEAEAMVPELAAARRPCNCRACRTRALHPGEPCSDYDGD